MIRTRADLRNYINEDAKRNGIFSLKSYVIGILLGKEQAHAYRYLRVLRHCEYHKNNKGLLHKIRYVFFLIIYGRLGFRYHILIPLNVCGKGVRLLHISGGGGILLNAKKIGDYCSFNSGVLIGNNRDNENKPVVGDYVGFGPGAKAIGKITIGNNVFVAPNAVVVKDVPDNCIVGGIPAKFIKYNDPK